MRQLALVRGAKTLVETCAAVKQGERLLVVTDSGRPFTVAEVVAIAGEHVGAVVTTVFMQPVATGKEPPDSVRGAMLEADVILAPVSGSLFHTTAAKLAVEAGARLISITEATEALLIDGGCLADFDAMAPVAEMVRGLLSNASELHVSAPAGTDVTMSLSGREGMHVTGLARNPGVRTAWPDIEAFIAPVEGTANGVVVVDASASNLGLIRAPIRFTVCDGRVVTIGGGGQAREVERSLAATGHGGSYEIAEFGVGLNPAGLVRGQIVEDEGVYGTAHVALGNNTNFVGGENWAPIHFDYVFQEPTVTLDGQTVMAAGQLVGDVRVEIASRAKDRKESTGRNA